MNTNFDAIYGVQDIIVLNEKYAAIIQESAGNIFDTTDSDPVPVEGKTKRGYIPWGSDNLMPTEILTKYRKDEVMSSNLYFNILCGYGAGFKYKIIDDSGVLEEVKKFFRHNRMPKYWLEQQTDLKHFFFTIAVLYLSRDGKKIVNIRHKEVKYCRFEKCNEKGIIENVLFANWDDDPKKDDIQVFKLLNEDDPYGDLLVQTGREPNPVDGKKIDWDKTTEYAVVNRIPIPGFTYYSFPYSWSVFNSGWADIKALVPVAKMAKMTNGLAVRYQILIHRDYFPSLYKEEGITDPDKKKERKQLEYDNIKTFLSGVEKSGKTWFTGFYVDANGKEQQMVKIVLIEKDKPGGDWIEDNEEAANIMCYAQGVHPSLIGAVPGKNKGSFSGSDKRELFTMKQALERAPRDILMEPLYIVKDFNGWDKIEFEIPDLMLTTLDQGTDAKTVTSNPNTDDTNND